MNAFRKLLAISLVFTLVQCNIWDGDKVSGEGPVVTKNIKIDDFNSIEVSNGWRVELIPNQSPQMIAKANQNLIDILEVKESNGKLSIGAKENIGSADSKLIKIYFNKNLKLITASSGGELTAEEKLIFGSTKIGASSSADIELNIKADLLEVEGSSESEIKLTANSSELTVNASSSADISIKAENKILNASASSGAEIELTGMSENVEFKATSGSDIDAEDLESKKVKAKASSGASIDCYPLDQLKATASSGANIRYHNNPSKNISSQSTSGGSIKKD